MIARIDHVSIVARDLDACTAFYDAALGAAGIGRVVAWQDVEDADEVGPEAVGYGSESQVLLWTVAGPEPTQSAHLAVRVADAAVVDAVAAAADGVPVRRERVQAGYYGVMLTDPDGNLLEVFTAR